MASSPIHLALVALCLSTALADLDAPGSAQREQAHADPPAEIDAAMAAWFRREPRSLAAAGDHGLVKESLLDEGELSLHPDDATLRQIEEMELLATDATGAGDVDCSSANGADVVDNMKWDDVKKEWIECSHGSSGSSSQPANAGAVVTVDPLEDPLVQASELPTEAPAASPAPPPLQIHVHLGGGAGDIDSHLRGDGWTPNSPWPSRYGSSWPPHPPAGADPLAGIIGSDTWSSATSTGTPSPTEDGEADIPPAAPCAQEVTENGTVVPLPLPKVRPVSDLGKSRLEDPEGPKSVGDAIEVIRLINRIKLEAYLEAGLHPPPYLRIPGGSGRPPMVSMPPPEEEEISFSHFRVTQKIMVQIGFFSMLAGAGTVGYGLHALKTAHEIADDAAKQRAAAPMDAQ